MAQLKKGQDSCQPQERKFMGLQTFSPDCSVEDIVAAMNRDGACINALPYRPLGPADRGLSASRIATLELMRATPGIRDRISLWMIS